MTEDKCIEINKKNNEIYNRLMQKMNPENINMTGWEG